MSRYYSVFQIGPVQEFVQSARKTQDFWSGSFLISFLNAKAIQTFGNSDVIFPETKESKIYEAATDAALPWLRRMVDAHYFPSIPNRFCAVSAEPPVERLDRAQKVVRKTWEEIAGLVQGAVERSLTRGSQRLLDPLSPGSAATAYSWNAAGERKAFNGLDRTQWREQIQKMSFEILYVWQAFPEEEPHEQAFLQIESLLGMRKASRIFETQPLQEGYACSLCGLRASLNPHAYKKREDLRRWWENAMRRSGQLRHRFRQGEHLCAVCTVKRLAPSLVFRAPQKDVPSTSTIAAAAFQKELQSLLTQIEDPAREALHHAVRDFRSEAVKACVSIDEPAGGRQPPYFRDFKSNRLLKLDGDCFFESFYEHPAHRGKTEEAYKAWLTLKKLCLHYDVRSPSKYYALIAADGDSMGEMLARVKSPETHRKVSRLLAQFAAEEIHRIFERNLPGFVLYWGGDEGMAVVPLKYVLEALQSLQKTWSAKVGQVLESLGLSSATLSAGAVIAHHQFPLRSAIREVRETLQWAKALDTMRGRKNAWAIKILRRAGGPAQARCHWEYETNGAGDAFSPLQLLDDFRKTYERKWISPRWLLDLRQEGTAMRDPPPQWFRDDPDTKEKWWENAGKIFDYESERLLLRHRTPGKATEKAELVRQLISETKKLNHCISNASHQEKRHRHEHLCALLDLPHYIAKGGGR